MPVVGGTGPEPDHVDGLGVRMIVALDRQLGLPRVDAGAVLFAVDAGNMIDAVVLLYRRADEAAREEVRSADRSAVGLR